MNIALVNLEIQEFTTLLFFGFESSGAFLGAALCLSLTRLSKCEMELGLW